LKKPIVQLRNVSRSYDKGKVKAVNRVSLDIFPGEFIVLLGSSGSGKSTLLNLITGLDTPTEGTVLFNGITPKNRAKWCSLRSSYVGFIFQSFNLLPTLTAIENVEIPMFTNKMTSREREARSSELLEKVGLSDRMSHLPSELSGGERQRVAIARSLANHPTLLVADEPTGNLDSKTSQLIIDLIEDIHLSEGTTLILVTHERRIAHRAKKIIQIADGRVLPTTIC